MIGAFLLFVAVVAAVTAYMRVVVPRAVVQLRESWPAVRGDFTAMRGELETRYTELEAARQLRALERAEAAEPDLAPEVIA